MNKFVVYGIGDFADIVTDLIENSLQYSVEAYILDDEYYGNNLYHNGKVVSKIGNIVNEYPPEIYDVAIGFIGNHLFDLREKAFTLLNSYGYRLQNLIHPSAVISTPNLGLGNIILENCVIGYKAKLGDGNIMWSLSSINHHNIVGSFNNFSPGSSTSGNVTIGDHCFLGNNSTYKNKITIADYTLVGAGAYITHDTQPYSVYVPQKSICLEGKKGFDFNL